MEEITKGLFALQDKNYREFHGKLMPETDPGTIIGVRTPDLRRYAKQVSKMSCAEAFLQELPHTYYEENNLHGALLSLLYKDLDEYLEKLELFLPFVDNWATCDTISPKVFKKDPELVYEYVKKWLQSDHVYTVRFGVVTLLGYYLDDAFRKEQLALVAGLKPDAYYGKMAVAWYFSTALVKQYEATLPYFTEPVLEPWTHNKALQKARESLRIDRETKEYLKTLKVPSA